MQTVHHEEIAAHMTAYVCCGHVNLYLLYIAAKRTHFQTVLFQQRR